MPPGHCDCWGEVYPVPPPPRTLPAVARAAARAVAVRVVAVKAVGMEEVRAAALAGVRVEGERAVAATLRASRIETHSAT